ncbi:hypothetical protein [Legionella tucsonensis]|uniref:Uncharacterized protein n=1 Tax=Legionella tucsonensis TaxID=40335 RepID=A0A0W0ZZK1_9GAMM|nr:hypothetical protein [Legionella tucsonensis]KTD74506.1 hypothetical protein Ltuc_2353 [Legionella tucsonensis]
MRTLDSSTVTSLQQQIGKYDAEGPFRIGLEAEHELYKGINDYDDKHLKKVRDYTSAYKEESHFFDSIDPQFFRKKFIEYIQTHPFPEYEGDPETRATHPEEATTDMLKFLGKQGLELFHLALEEEVNSKEFRDAVVIKSTSHLDGPKWQERPVVIVAGPSASGKSYAAKAAMNKANQFLGADFHDMSGNDVIAADGGIVREVSQMRKLVIQLANKQGYTGISDLYSKSNKLMDGIKNRVREAAFLTPGVGVVIPETFTSWIVSNKGKDMLGKIEHLSDTKHIFTRVEGHERSNFKKVVAFMGSRRAWKTKDFIEQELDLNREGLSESKAYNSNAFFLGELGSKHAEAWFKKNSKDKLNMIITNDLILLKPDPDQPGNWIAAEANDEGARLFSESAYKLWQKLPSKPDLIDYCNSVSRSLITTSPQLVFGIAQNKIRLRIDAGDEKIDKVLSNMPINEERLRYLKLRQELLSGLANFSLENLESWSDIEQMRNQLDEQMLVLKSDPSAKRIFTKKTEDAINTFTEMLDKACEELQNGPTFYEERSETCFFKSEYKKTLSNAEDCGEKNEDTSSCSPT